MIRDPVNISCTIEASGPDQFAATLSRVAAALRLIRTSASASNFSTAGALESPPASSVGSVPSFPLGKPLLNAAPPIPPAASATPGGAIPRLNSFPALPLSGGSSTTSPLPHGAAPLLAGASPLLPGMSSPLTPPSGSTPPNMLHPVVAQQMVPHLHPQMPAATMLPPHPQYQSMHPPLVTSPTSVLSVGVHAPQHQQPQPQVMQVQQAASSSMAVQSAGAAPTQARSSEPSVEWLRLIDMTRADTAARDIGRVLDHAPPQTLVVLARHFTQPAHAAVIAAMAEPHRTRLRDAVLQNVLAALTSEESQETAGENADVLMALNRHNLVVMKGVVKTVDALLRAPKTFKAGIAVLGRLIAQLIPIEGAVAQLRSAVAGLQSIVAEGCGRHPGLAYEQIYIEEHMAWRTAKGQLQRMTTISTPHTRSVVSSVYIAARDELVTGGWEGAVAGWSGSAEPWVMQLPFGYHACSMDASSRGNSLVVAGASTAARPIIQIFGANESGWSLRESVTRNDFSVVSNVKCLASRGAAICAAGFDGVSRHNLAYLDAAGAAVRDIEEAHSDFITCLAGSADNENWLLSGSRDTTVRVWDNRQTKDNKPAHMCSFHSDTITSIATYRDLLLVTSLDRRLSVWDSRKLKAPIAEKVFDAPLLRVATGPQATAVVASTSSLNFITVHPLQIQDVVPGVVATELRVSHDHSVVFAAGASAAVNVFTMKFIK